MNRKQKIPSTFGNESCGDDEVDVKQLFVDVSTLVHVDDGTGIQRVVWNILENLLVSPPTGYKIRPVRRDKGKYYYTDSCISGKQLCYHVPEHSLITVEKGDVFLGLDFDHKFNRRAQRFLRKEQRGNGLRVYFVVYDLLAVTHPEWFNRHLASLVNGWLARVSSVADGLICISQSVSQELKIYLDRKKQLNDLEIGFFHLGADIVSKKQDSELSLDEKQIIQWLATQTVFLMIGTLEPRKGHQLVLETMSKIWASGRDVHLVIVGKQGWKTERLADEIDEHPENGEHLFWFENVSDTFLLQLYTVSSALIMASEGEGFGLPLVEAAQHHLPLIARDLPVFREVAGDHAFYFSGSTGSELQKSLSDWLQLYKENRHPESQRLHWLTWEQSSRQLLNAVLKQS